MVDRNQLPGEDEIRLEIGGRTFAAWESVKVSRSIESAAASFAITVATKRPFPLQPGDQVRVVLEPDVLLDGHIDDVRVATKPERVEVKLTGRDGTADLVDCSAAAEPGEFLDLELDDLVRELAAPFGVGVNNEAERFVFPFGQPVRVSDEGTLFQRFKVQTGESAWSAIERACRLKGRLCFSEGLGVLVIAKPAARNSQAALVEGRDGNVEAAEMKMSARERFSVVTVKGQAPGSDEGWGEETNHVEGRARDLFFGDRFRPKIVMAEGPLGLQDARVRAEWEVVMRAARAATLDVTVKGWRQFTTERPARPWRVNEVVPVRIPSIPVARPMLVRAVNFERDGSGTRTKLSLTRENAYQPQPTVERSEEPFGEFLDEEVVE